MTWSVTSPVLRSGTSNSGSDEVSVVGGGEGGFTRPLRGRSLAITSRLFALNSAMAMPDEVAVRRAAQPPPPSLAPHATRARRGALGAC